MYRGGSYTEKDTRDSLRNRHRIEKLTKIKVSDNTYLIYFNFISIHLFSFKTPILVNNVTYFYNSIFVDHLYTTSLFWYFNNNIYFKSNK